MPEHVFSTSADIGSDVAKLGVSDGTWHVVSTTHDSVELDAVHPESGPAVKQIVFRTFPNSDALIDALAHKDVDVVSGLPAADVGRLEALPRVTVNHASDGTKYILRFERGPTPLRRSFLSRRRAQRPVSLAIDRADWSPDASTASEPRAPLRRAGRLVATELQSCGRTQP